MRISRDQMMMDIARTVARRGTCSRLQVGAVVSRDGRVLTMGYNGAPAGLEHCNHMMNETEGCTRAVHAEANAAVWAARNGVRVEGADLYVTHMPCLACASLIVNAGIRRVFYEKPYRITLGVDLLREAGVLVYCLTS